MDPIAPSLLKTEVPCPVVLSPDAGYKSQQKRESNQNMLGTYRLLDALVDAIGHFAGIVCGICALFHCFGTVITVHGFGWFLRLGEG